jgi:parvulin-like peptidyl-prolyl isomerase
MNKKIMTALIALGALFLVGAVAMTGIALSDPSAGLEDFMGEIELRLTALEDRIAQLEEGAGAKSAAVPSPEASAALAEIDGEPITYQQVYDYMIDSQGSFLDASELEDQAVLNDYLLQALHEMVESEVLVRMAAGLGVEPSDQAVADEIDAQYIDYYAQALEVVAADSADEADAKAQAEELLVAYGLDRESLSKTARQDARRAAVRDKVAESALPDLTSEAALKTLYEESVADAKARYEEEPSGFEYELYYFDAPVYYTPEGYRGVKHILILFDEDTGVEAEALFSALEEEGLSEEDRRATLEKIDGLKAGYGEQIGQITAALDGGESFDALVERYGEDPGMLESPTRERGYYVSAASDFWDLPFRDAAMALTAIGDVSAPVVSSSGIHFLKYVADVPSGPVAYEAVKDDMLEEVVDSAKEDAYLQAFDEWEEKLGVVLHEAVLQPLGESAAVELDPEVPTPE